MPKLGLDIGTSAMVRQQAKIFKNYPDLIQGEIKEFLQIHTKKKDKSPMGAPIKMADRGILKTYYTDEQVIYK